MLVIHGPGESLLAHARGRWESGQGQSDAVWAGHAAVGGGDDTGVFAGSSGALGAGVWDHQGRLPQDWLRRHHGQGPANAYVRDVYLPAFNAEFAHPAREDGSAFVPYPASVVLDDILCEQAQRTVGKDNCVRLNGLVLQIPADRHRYHYIKAKVTVAGIWMGH